MSIPLNPPDDAGRPGSACRRPIRHRWHLRRTTVRGSSGGRLPLRPGLPGASTSSIVGTDLRLVERVLGRHDRGRRPTGAGALSGAWLGLLIGILLSIFTSSGLAGRDPARPCSSAAVWGGDLRRGGPRHDRRPA